MSHRLGYRLGQLVSLICGWETRVSWGAQQVDPQRQLGLVWAFSFSYPRSFLPDFILLLHYSGVYFLALFSCARYLVWDTPRAWNLRSLQSMLNGPLYLGLFGSCVSFKLMTIYIIIRELSVCLSHYTKISFLCSNFN